MIQTTKTLGAVSGLISYPTIQRTGLRQHQRRDNCVYGCEQSLSPRWRTESRRFYARQASWILLLGSKDCHNGVRLTGCAAPVFVFVPMLKRMRRLRAMENSRPYHRLAKTGVSCDRSRRRQARSVCIKMEECTRVLRLHHRRL